MHFDFQLIQAIQSGIDRTNARATSQAQKIQKWVVLPTDFSIPGGELGKFDHMRLSEIKMKNWFLSISISIAGPTLKLKRSVVYEKYSETIADMYKFGQRE
jgi:long-chain-fatty-acid--CoA ligase ACSBG